MQDVVDGLRSKANNRVVRSVSRSHKIPAKHLRMECFEKIFTLTIFEKRYILDVWKNSKYTLGSEYARILHFTLCLNFVVGYIFTKSFIYHAVRVHIFNCRNFVQFSCFFISRTFKKSSNSYFTFVVS